MTVRALASTSPVSSDEAVTQEASIPATRKIALPTPRTAATWGMAARMAEHLQQADDFAPLMERHATQPQSLDLRNFYESDDEAPPEPQHDQFNVSGLADAIGWLGAAALLRRVA